jgi:hypothetical protein
MGLESREQDAELATQELVGGLWEISNTMSTLKIYHG